MGLKIAVFSRYRLHSANGVDRTIRGHLDGFRGAGHHVTLLTVEKPDRDAEEELRRICVDCIVLPVSLLELGLEALKIRRDFDLLWLHSVFSPRNWVLYLVFRGDIIVTPHGGYSPESLSGKNPLRKKIAVALIERKMLSRALFVHSLATEESAHIRKVSSKASCIFAMNGLHDVPEISFKKGVGSGLRTFVYIGRIAIQHKGLDLLLEGFSRLDSKLQWRLEIVGKGDLLDERELKALVERYKLGSKVVIHGALFGERKQEVLEGGDVFVHPSRWDGMPFSVIEALGNAVPVMITQKTNMGDLVLGYDAGWVVDSSAESIGSQLAEIVDGGADDLLIKSKNGLRLAQKELRWSRVMLPIIEVLGEYEDNRAC